MFADVVAVTVAFVVVVVVVEAVETSLFGASDSKKSTALSSIEALELASDGDAAVVRSVVSVCRDVAPIVRFGLMKHRT